jgi:hypothetical protein
MTTYLRASMTLPRGFLQRHATVSYEFRVPSPITAQKNVNTSAHKPRGCASNSTTHIFFLRVVQKLLRISPVILSR